MTTRARPSIPVSPWRWLVRGALLGPVIGGIAALVTGYIFANSVSASLAALDGPSDFYIPFVRAGLVLGFIEGIIFGLVMHRVVGIEDRQSKTGFIALAAQLPVNMVLFAVNPSLWTFFALLMLAPVLTILTLRILFAVDRRTGRTGL